MILIDSSVWIEVWEDRSGAHARTLEGVLQGVPPVFTRFTELEVLQGSRDEREWALLREFFASQELLGLGDEGWAGAARIYYDLRRRGVTVRSTIDCCIAQVALDRDLLVVHRDQDFESIASIRPLRQLRLDLGPAADALHEGPAEGRRTSSGSR